jgi:hypothetical protein
VPLARRRRLDGAQRLLGLAQGDGDALVQRRCFGGVDLTEASVHLSEGAGPAHGYGACCGRPCHPDDSSHCNDNPRPFTWHKRAEEILDRLAGSCHSLNN